MYTQDNSRGQKTKLISSAKLEIRPRSRRFITNVDILDKESSHVALCIAKMNRNENKFGTPFKKRKKMKEIPYFLASTKPMEYSTISPIMA